MFNWPLWVAMTVLSFIRPISCSSASLQHTMTTTIIIIIIIIIRPCRNTALKTQLKKVAINDVLPLKAARCNVTSNIKFSGTSKHQRLNLDSFIYIRRAAPSYYTRTVITASICGRWVKTTILFSVILHSFVQLKTITKYAFADIVRIYKFINFISSFIFTF